MTTQLPHLLSLPAELRLHIYSFVLAPTNRLYLSSTRERRHAVTPPISPALLRTCRQVHHEAKNILYAENTISIVIDAHDTCWPTISESRLPQRVLERLEHLEALLDCTSFFCASYRDVDFLPFVAMVKLKGLRLRMLTIDRKGEAGDEVPRFGKLAAEILERVKPEVMVVYGAGRKVTGGSDGEIPIAEVIARRSASTNETAVEVPAGDLEESMLRFQKSRQGCKAEQVSDVWSEYRSDMSAAWRGQESAV